MRRLIVSAALCAAVLGAAAPASAADLEPVIVPGGKHVRYARYWDWRDRCAWANQYCLYVWHGYVYHYPYDELAYAYTPRRHRR